MSFADELRNAPNERKKEEDQKRQLELEQQRKDWQFAIEKWYKYIKGNCKKDASNGYTSYTGSFENFINGLDQTTKSSGDPLSWLENVRPRICYQLDSKYPDRVQVCLSEEDVADIEDTIKKLLEADGLIVEFQRREYKKYKYERVFVEHSEGERVAASILNSIFPSNTLGLRGSKGSYQNQRKSDGLRYGISVTVSW